MDMSEQNQVAIETPTIAGTEISVPLSQLFRDPLNVRKKRSGSVEGLASLILSQSLLQNLVVRAELGKRKRRTGRFGVVAGGRRLEALQLLLSQRKIADDYPVRCLEVSQEDAISVSVAENCEREALHGADLFDAFKAMADQGKTPRQIADSWGVEVRTVEKRLKLGNVAPSLLALYREDGISVDALIALTLTDDHATQESVWARCDAEGRRSPYYLRQELTAGSRPGSDDAVRFVGLDAYERAGGTVVRDLFAQGDDDCRITNIPLLERLVAEHLEGHAAALREEGWAWVEVRADFPSMARREFGTCRVHRAEPTPEQSAQLQAIEARIEALEAERDALDYDDDDAEVEAKLEAANAEHEALSESLLSFADSDKARAGAVVYLDGGAPGIARGLIRPGDEEADDQDEEAGHVTPSGSRPKAQPEKAEFSERLMRQLSAHKTAALRAMLADDARIALRVLAYQMACLTFFRGGYGGPDRPVEIEASFASLKDEGPDLADSLASTQFEERKERLGDSLPGSKEGLLSWLLSADDPTVMEVLAVCTAGTLNAVHGRERDEPIADRIASALQLDMADWWKPTVSSYLSAVPKAKILAALAEAAPSVSASTLDGLKKDALARAVQGHIEDTRWLPAPLKARTA